MILAKVITIEKSRWQKVRVVKIGNKKQNFYYLRTILFYTQKPQETHCKKPTAKLFLKIVETQQAAWLKK